MTAPELQDIEKLEPPYRREIVLQEAIWQSGMKLLRIRIREGNRFTLVDLDRDTAQRMAKIMSDWCTDQIDDGEENNGTPR